jgi:hypothetical protein
VSWVRAITSGLLLTLAAVNVWPITDFVVVRFLGEYAFCFMTDGLHATDQ